MSDEHLKTVLESPSCLGLLSEVAAQFAWAEIPEEIVKDTSGQDDGIAEVGWWSPGHRHGRVRRLVARKVPCALSTSRDTQIFQALTSENPEAHDGDKLIPLVRFVYGE